MPCLEHNAMMLSDPFGPTRSRGDHLAALLIRLGFGAVFLAAALNTLQDIPDSLNTLHGLQLPALLVPLNIGLDLAGGLALILGWHTRWTALIMAEYSVFYALLYHADLGWLLAAGLLLLAMHGSGRFALDCLAALCEHGRSTRPVGKASETVKAKRHHSLGCR